jgi:hypothetical protein
MNVNCSFPGGTAASRRAQMPRAMSIAVLRAATVPPRSKYDFQASPEASTAFGACPERRSITQARQVHEAESNANFWLYVVENVRQGDPALFRLILLGGEQLTRLVAKKKAQTTYTVPFPVAEFDTAPRGTMPAP